MSEGDERFVCEQLIPAAGTFETGGMSRGEPGLPASFTWREREYRIVALCGKWKSDGPCRNGSSEMYLRRHWYKVRTEPAAAMTIYFDRQATDRGKPRNRWWIYTVADVDEAAD